VRSFHEPTQVTFGDLSDEVIDAYVNTGTPMYVLSSSFFRGLTYHALVVACDL